MSLSRRLARALAVAALVASSGCASMDFQWPHWFSDMKLPDFPAFDEYTESPKSYLTIALEHDFLVRVKPWERAVLARPDMSWEPDSLEAARRNHTYFSKEATMPGGSAGGGGCGCN
jgi:uncharacterized protein DUF4266